MKATVITCEPNSEYAKSKQPINGKGRKSLFTYFVKYGEMTFGPFYSESQYGNFLVKHGFRLDCDDNGIFYTQKFASENENLISNHYSLYN